MKAIYDAIKQEIATAENILVATHLDPDGDALGSLTAMGAALKQLGKQVTMAVDGGVTSRFRYLNLADEIQSSITSAASTDSATGRSEPSQTPYDLLIALDCGDTQRIGQIYATLDPIPTIINIDHHVTNPDFGKVNLVALESASTAEALCALLPTLGVEITEPIATSLLTGIVTDTLGFRTSNVTPATVNFAADMMKIGANLPVIAMKALNIIPFSAIQLWQIGFNNLKLEDGLIWTTINQAEAASLGGDQNSGGLVSKMSDVDTAAISIVFSEKADGRINISFRCRPPFNVSNIAISLGGGGHPNASGCTVDGPLAAVEARIVAICKREISAQRIANK